MSKLKTIQEIINDSKNDTNLAIIDDVTNAVSTALHNQHETGKTFSSKIDIAEGKMGTHVFIPFAIEAISDLPLPIDSGLYPFQEEALAILKDLVMDEYYFSGDGYDAPTHFRELIINLPTGSGKTRIFLELLSWWKDFNIVVIAAPTISLLRQIEFNTKKFMENANRKFEYAIVCSDKTLSDDEMASEEDQEILDRMMQYGEATTCPFDLSKKINSRKNPLIVFTTYRSLEKVGKAAKYSKVELDLLIADEGHRLCDKPQNTCLMKKILPVKFKAFFTATVREKISNTEKVMAFPMTNVDLFGPVAYKKLPMELIHGGYILPPVLVARNWKSQYHSKLLKLLGNNLLEVEDDVKHEFALFLSGLIHVYTKTGKIKNIAFVQSIKVAKWYSRQIGVIEDILSTWFDKEINIYQGVISQEIVGTERIKLLKEFDNSENGLLLNYQVIKEGIDIQSCNSVTLLRKMDSVGLMQVIGRAMRVDHQDPGKKYGYVICPINVDGNEKGKSIERMREVAQLLITEGYQDIIIDENNNSDRTPGDGTGDERDVRNFNIENMSVQQVHELFQHVDENGIIDDDYFISCNDKATIKRLTEW